MNWVFPYEQAAHRRRFASTYFSQLPILEKTRPHEFLGAFAEKLVPATCSPADEKPLADFIDAHPNFDAVAIKDIKVAKQENARCVKVRALIESGS